MLLGASSSLGNGKADPNWGGANVWASLDGSSYAQIASINGATPQGFSTAYLASASGWDTTNTLSVDLTESGGTLTGTTQAGAEGGVTLCLIDNELIGYATATLTAPNKYNLTGLARGLFGTTPTAHGTGAAFARLDTTGPVVTYPLPTPVDRRDALSQISVVQSVRRLGARPVRLHALRPRRHRAGRPRPDRRATLDRDAGRPRPDRRHADALRRFRLCRSISPSRSSTSATSPSSAIRSRRRSRRRSKRCRSARSTSARSRAPSRSPTTSARSSTPRSTTSNSEPSP